MSHAAIDEFQGTTASKFKVGFVSARAVYVERGEHDERALQALCEHVNSACSIQLTHTRIEEQELDCAREAILREARELVTAEAEAEAAAAAAAAEQQAPNAEASSSEPGPSAPPVVESAAAAFCR